MPAVQPARDVEPRFGFAKYEPRRSDAAAVRRHGRRHALPAGDSPDVYTGPQPWPGMLGNFTASFFAFVIALAWNRREVEEERLREVEERASRIHDETEQERERRNTEAGRRLATVGNELEHNLRQIKASRLGA